MSTLKLRIIARDFGPQYGFHRSPDALLQDAMQSATGSSLELYLDFKNTFRDPVKDNETYLVCLEGFMTFAQAVTHGLNKYPSKRYCFVSGWPEILGAWLSDAEFVIHQLTGELP